MTEVCPRCGAEPNHIDPIEPWLTRSGYEERVAWCGCGHRWKLPRDAKKPLPPRWRERLR